MTYERFTDKARKVMQLANQEAQRFNQKFVGTEHILLGLLNEGSGVAANVLNNLDVDLQKVRCQVEKRVQRESEMVTRNVLPRTPRAKKVIEYSIEEACRLNHDYVGTEHILLGLLREQEGVAAQILINVGLTLEEVREEILNLLGHGRFDPIVLYERFTDRVRMVMHLAKQEAVRRKHKYLGTEHILLGLADDLGVAAKLMKSDLDVDLGRIRDEVERLIQSVRETATSDGLPPTLAPGAKSVIEYAMEEARKRNQDYIGTEHVLLGLLQQQNGIAAQVLTNMGLTLAEARERLDLLIQ